MGISRRCSCGADNPPNANFCTSCGLRLGQRESVNVDSTGDPPKRGIFRWNNWVLWAIFVAVFIFLIVIASVTETPDGESRTVAPEPTVIPDPTATPVPPQRIRAEALYAEREANASRYDMNYMGKLITISGVVGEVDDGEVRLVVDMESYRVLGGIFLKYVALDDLSQQEQASANKGEEFTAICEVGNYVSGRIQLEDCRK